METHATPAAPARTAHEHGVWGRLAGIEGIERGEGDDEAGHSLAQSLESGPCEPAAVVALAIDLATTLAAVHGRGISHLDIHPGHVVFRAASRRTLLRGFGRATAFASQQPGFTHHLRIEGDLAFLAPEQTGRTGRGVDFRADLYSLGATLYAAATGAPPFPGGDPLQALHDLLAAPPVPPASLQRAVPEGLSRVILRLLEKEPERRYQGCEGLLHDLAIVQQAMAGTGPGLRELGSRDFPAVLTPPARLVGRAGAVQALGDALARAVEGPGEAVLAAGPPGVGKTSLVRELRPMVTARRGWFVSGQCRAGRVEGASAPVQALRALGALLLAEPEFELAAHRERILRACQGDAQALATLPEFAALLGLESRAQPLDSPSSHARVLRALADVARAVATPRHPLVLVFDDLHWAQRHELEFIEALRAAHAPGLLVVGTCRDDGGSEAAGIAGFPQPVHLGNLGPAELCELLAQMLRLPPGAAGELAAAVGVHTHGNPFDTVELLNALRREGALRCTADGWSWDAPPWKVPREGQAPDLPTSRVARMDTAARSMLVALACLGGRAPRDLLAAATQAPDGEVDQFLELALRENLVDLEPGSGEVCFRHDRVLQAVQNVCGQKEACRVHLDMARRLAAMPAWHDEAARQYLRAGPALANEGEMLAALALMQGAAVRAARRADYAQAQGLSAGAASIGDRLPPTVADRTAVVAAHVLHHTALCTLGHLEEADAAYRAIEDRGEAPEHWIEAACTQLYSLFNRSQVREAMQLGLSLLHRLAIEPPADFDAAGVGAGLARLGEWLATQTPGEDSRPHAAGLRGAARARLIHRLCGIAYFADIRIMGWLLLQAWTQWKEEGPSPELALALSSLGAPAVAINGDFRTGYAGARHFLAVSQSRGWEAALAEGRFLFASHSSHWGEPVEGSVAHLKRARAGLMALGELQTVCFTFRPLVTAMLDCARSLDDVALEIEAGLAQATRIRHDYILATLAVDWELLARLRGGDAASRMAPAARDAFERLSSTPVVRLQRHFNDALLATLFGDDAQLLADARAAVEQSRRLASWRVAQARLVHALALARDMASGSAQADSPALLDAELAWLAKRAEEVPANFRHTVSWIEAERAWAAGDFRAAAAAFDAALGELEDGGWPWHRALATERAGLFNMQHGLKHAGRALLDAARRMYAGWGAHAKVRQMEAVHGFSAQLPADGEAPAAPVDRAPGPDTIDAVAILRASQVLSSERSLARLQARVSEVVGALTGATAVRFVFWEQAAGDWFVAGNTAGRPRIAAGDPEADMLLPLAPLRYAQRTREPVLVDDAAADDRFAHDAYMQLLGHGSLMLVPILHQGNLRAMLLLENRQRRGAFGAARLDAVALIAGQLAVSLDNAMLYEQLERRVREQTDELLDSARRAGMAQVATNVLHNVGNVLNNVNTSAHVLASRLRDSRVGRVADVSALLHQHAGDLGGFLVDDERGKHLPAFLQQLGEALQGERQEMLDELERLSASIGHIKNVVSVQQSYAGAGGLLERCSVTDLVEDALAMQSEALAQQGVALVRDFAAVPRSALDRTRVMQVLVNLLDNARQAMHGMPGERSLHVSVMQAGDRVKVKVRDEGCGIPPDNLPQIFSHGFTTKRDGHGFGLHSCAVAAMEMGGRLSAQSEGVGTGATFILELPLETGAGATPRPAKQA